MWSPDYKGMDPDEAFNDFRARVRKYEAVYEPLTNRNVHYIKLTGELADNPVLGGVNHVVYMAWCWYLALTQPGFPFRYGDWARLDGRESHLWLHPWEDCLLPHANMQGGHDPDAEDMADEARRVVLQRTRAHRRGL